MALGRQLVEELQLEPGVDTLGRWMAHHLADLMVRAENTEDPAQRVAATDEVVETILRIWSHRSAADRINPLTDVMPLLSILRAVAQDAPLWASFSGPGYGDAARRTYDLLRRLTICLSILELGGVEAAQRGLDRAGRTGAWQSDEERELVEHMSLWAESGAPEQEKHRRGSRRAKGGAPSMPSLDRTDTALQIVDSIEASLADLRKILQKRDP